MNNKEIHRLFKQYGCNAREWLRKCALLLPEIEQRKIWQDEGFGSIYEYAAKLAGMSKSSVHDALWVMRKIADKPALMRMVEKKGINRVKPIANVATKNTEEFWAEKVRDMSRGTLRVFVKGLKDQEPSFFEQTGQIEQIDLIGRADPTWQAGQNDPTGRADLTGQAERNDVGKQKPHQSNCWAGPTAKPVKVAVSVSLELELAKRFEQIQKRADFEVLIEKFLGFVENADAENKPAPVVTKSEHIPVKIKKFVTNQTGDKCAFPGCLKKGAIFHHTQRFALEKVHDPDRIVLLCKEHERLAHLGLIENEDNSPYRWKLRKEADRNDDKFFIDQQVWLRR